MWATLAVMPLLILTVVVLIVIASVTDWGLVKKGIKNDLKRRVIGMLMLVLRIIVVQFVALTAQGQGDEAKSGDEQQWFDFHGELLI